MQPESVCIQAESGWFQPKLVCKLCQSYLKNWLWRKFAVTQSTCKLQCTENDAIIVWARLCAAWIQLFTAETRLKSTIIRMKAAACESIVEMVCIHPNATMLHFKWLYLGQLRLDDKENASPVSDKFKPEIHCVGSVSIFCTPKV